MLWTKKTKKKTLTISSNFKKKIDATSIDAKGKNLFQLKKKSHSKEIKTWVGSHMAQVNLKI